MFKGTRQFGTTNAAAEAPLLDSIQNRFEIYRTIKDSLQRRAYYHKIDSLSQLAAKYFIPNEYDKLMSAIGAEGTNAFTSNDMTCYVEDIPSNEVENWARIEADRFQNMVIRGFHTELEAVYEEYNIGLASDREKQFNAFSKLVFPGHPYGTQTTIGTQEHLKNPSIVNIKNYFKRYYVPNNVAICMSGDFNPDEVIAIIDKYFGSWKPNANLSQPQYAPVPDRTAPVDTTVVGQEAENIYLGWKFEGSASYQADTLGVVADMLSNGTAGLMDLDLDQQMKWLGGGAVTMPLAEYSAMIMIGYPKEGQTLDEVKALMLGEIDKLKRGDFDENLIKAVVNNKKLQYYRTLESNDDRAYMMADAFITRKKWSDVVGELDRISGITKQQIIDFARRHFTDGYVAVYKRIGNDTTIKKIDKPEITAIPANRDLQSAFVKEITDSKVEPIQPKFVDFDKDLTKATTKNGLPVLYVKNTENGRFTLTYHFDFGGASDKWLPYAASYFDYLGTDKMTAEQLKQKFYSLACSHGISIGTRAANIYVSGLAENMTEAMALMDDLLANAQVDTAAYDKYVGVELKARADNKLDQEELKEMEPQRLVDMVKAFSGYKHTVLYYGPMELNELTAAIDKYHKTAKTLADAPKSRNYMMQQTAQNEVYIAPYDAKNIYMVQFHNENRQWNPANQPVVSLFNEYYGGGMNSVVFQELREARGLAYSAFADYGTPSYEGEPEYAYTYIISQNDKMMDCIRTFNSILDTMPQSEKALGLAKQALMKRLATARITKEGIINAYLNAKDLGIDYSLSKKIYEAVPSLTMDDVVKFEQETMAKKPYRYLILGDEKQLDMKALEKIGPIKRLTTEDIFGY